MALNIATFKTRAITALVFVVVMLAGMLFNHWSFFILFSVVHFGCWIEYQKLICLIYKDYTAINPIHKYGVMIAGWCIMLFFTNDAFAVFGTTLHAIGMKAGLIAVVAVLVSELLFYKQLNLKNIGWSFLGLLYISLSLALLVNLRCFKMIHKGQHSYFDFTGFVLPLGVLVSLWINDTMAYIVGSFIGKTPFSKISPKKTWEGTLGGAILCVIVISLLGHWLVNNWKDWAVIAAIAAIAGTTGDLFESKLKRMAGVKDSGSIMPGHGGFLDRFDSLLFAAPCAWLYVTLFVK